MNEGECDFGEPPGTSPLPCTVLPVPARPCPTSVSGGRKCHTECHPSGENQHNAMEWFPGGQEGVERCCASHHWPQGQDLCPMHGAVTPGVGNSRSVCGGIEAEMKNKGGLPRLYAMRYLGLTGAPDSNTALLQTPQPHGSPPSPTFSTFPRAMSLCAQNPSPNGLLPCTPQPPLCATDLAAQAQVRYFGKDEPPAHGRPVGG